MKRAALLPWVLAAAWAGAPRVRSIQYSDLAPPLRSCLSQQGISEEGFPGFVRSLERETAERLREGENDHLIFYLLQSRRFTAEPRIEPALSAREYAEQRQVPPAVERRIRDFLLAARRPSTDPRLAYLRTLLPPADQTRYLRSQYARAMQFLYQKEFAPGDAAPGGKGRYLAALYQDRGHSSDTRIEANFAVWTALAVLKARRPSLRLNRVLLVGPGLDFAPRTGLLDTIEPQSYQPFAVADALLGLALADRGRLRIDCVDINDRVIGYLQGFPKRKRPALILFSQAGDPEYQEYFAAFGKSIGAAAGLPAEGPYRRKSVVVRREVAQSITAEKLNILTQRYDPPPAYDLAIATNVFVYFKPADLLLALANISAMLGPAGCLIHNEFRPEMDTFTRLLGLESTEARTLRLSSGGAAPLVDGFVIHRKMAAPPGSAPR